MNTQFELDYLCPVCGERNEITVEGEPGMRLVFTEDCAVCCRPNRISCVFDFDGNPALSADFEG